MKKVYQGKSNRRAIRDYSKRRYGNPLFRQNTRARSGSSVDIRRVKRIALAVLAVVVAGVLVWYLIWSGTFGITSVEVSGASSDTESVIRGLMDERMRMRRAFVFPQSSVFMFDTEAARNDVEGRFYFETLDIRKKLPGSLVIEVSEKSPVATYLSGSRFMAVDSDGFIIRELTERESMAMSDLPEGMGAVVTGELGAEAVDIDEISGAESDPEEIRSNDNPNPLVLERNGSENEPSPGDSALSRDALTLILQAYASLPEVTGSGIRWFSVDTTADTVDISLKSGWGVYMTTLLPFDVQKERLSLVLKEKIGERRSELEYVDLRYDERIFFRFKEEE